VDIAHKAGKLLVFHSCGNMYKLMDELIDDVGIDAKHSYEDKIVPVDEAYRRWGDRVAILVEWTWTCSVAGRKSRCAPVLARSWRSVASRYRLLPG